MGIVTAGDGSSRCAAFDDRALPQHSGGQEQRGLQDFAAGEYHSSRWHCRFILSGLSLDLRIVAGL